MLSIKPPHSRWFFLSRKAVTFGSFAIEIGNLSAVILYGAKRYVDKYATKLYATCCFCVDWFKYCSIDLCLSGMFMDNYGNNNF